MLKHVVFGALTLFVAAVPARADRISSVPAVRRESFAEVSAAEALLNIFKDPASTVNGLHLKVGTAMI